ncbi:MAG: hypothetical protein BYD32DRAFT_441325 [Podila humilis]|nr:MAG: hypothetical protein BYD32DRAFT_441325 [Podila humilis]
MASDSVSLIARATTNRYHLLHGFGDNSRRLDAWLGWIKSSELDDVAQGQELSLSELEYSGAYSSVAFLGRLTQNNGCTTWRKLIRGAADNSPSGLLDGRWIRVGFDQSAEFYFGLAVRPDGPDKEIEGVAVGSKATRYTFTHSLGWQIC